MICYILVYFVYSATRYPEIDKEAQKYMNSKGALFFPDYPDILKVVTDASKTHGLFIAEVQLGDIGALETNY